MWTTSVIFDLKQPTLHNRTVRYRIGTTEEKGDTATLFLCEQGDVGIYLS